MTNIPIRLLLISTVLPLLHAAEKVVAPWNQVCKVADGHPVIITTSDGSTTEGTCFSVNADEITVNTRDRGAVKIARTALKRIQMHLNPDPNQGHQLRALGRDMHAGLKHGFGWLFSPSALAGLVAVPATLAWGAVSAPFCILGDIGYQLSDDHGTDRDINVI